MSDILIRWVKSETFKYIVPVSMTFIGVVLRLVVLFLGLAYLNKLMPGLEVQVPDIVFTQAAQLIVGVVLLFLDLWLLQLVNGRQLVQSVAYILQTLLVVYVCVVAYVYVHYVTATHTQFVEVLGLMFYKTIWGQLELLQILQQHILSSGLDLPPVCVLNALVGSSSTPEGVICAYEEWLVAPPPSSDEDTTDGWLDWLSSHQEVIVGGLAALTTLISLASLGYKVYSLGLICSSLFETCKSMGVDPNGVSDLSSRVDELCKSVSSARTENLTLSRSIGEIRLNLAELSHRTTPTLDKLVEKTSFLDEKTTENLAAINELYKVSSFLIEKLTGH